MYKSTPERFYLGYAPNSTSSEVYEVLADAAALTYLSVCNSNITQEVFKAYIVPSGQSVANSYMIVNVSIDPDETVELGLKKPVMLDAGDKIYISTTTSSKVSCVMCGLTLELV